MDTSDFSKQLLSCRIFYSLYTFQELLIPFSAFLLSTFRVALSAPLLYFYQWPREYAVNGTTSHSRLPNRANKFFGECGVGGRATCTAVNFMATKLLQ